MPLYRLKWPFLSRTDKQHQIPLIKGSKNLEFHALKAIFRIASANSTNKGHRDSRRRGLTSSGSVIRPLQEANQP
jgi:hypothetical protein